MKQVGLTKQLRDIKSKLDSSELSEGAIPFGRRIKEGSLRTIASNFNLDVSKDSDNEVFLITKKKEDVNLEVEYDYQPEERQTRDYPGCGEEAAIEAVYVVGEDIIELLSEKQLQEIEIIVLKEREELIKAMKYGL